jgi:hypothetical protein
MYTTKLTIVLAASVFAFNAQAAECVNTNKVATIIERNFGETLNYVGVIPNGNTIELYHNSKNDSWSAVVSVPTKSISCLVATGKGEYKEYLAALK